MGFSGFDIIFNLFPLFFLLVLGIIIFQVVKSIGEWNRNNNSPIETAEAKVVGKRTKTDSTPHTMDNMTHYHTDTTYYATFQLGNGERLEFKISGRDYGLLAENDSGTLIYQGTRFKDFQRKL